MLNLSHSRAGLFDKFPCVIARKNALAWRQIICLVALALQADDEITDPPQGRSISQRTSFGGESGLQGAMVERAVHPLVNF